MKTSGWILIGIAAFAMYVVYKANTDTSNLFQSKNEGFKIGSTVTLQKDFPLGNSTFISAGTTGNVISSDANNTTIYANGQNTTIPNGFLS